MPLLLLFRKRSRSRRLLICKRIRNAFGSLPTFCEYVCGTNISMVRLFTSEQALYRLLWFFSKIRVRSYRCSSFFVKRHAQLSCSVVNALTTARCRYHLFTILRAFGTLKPLILCHFCISPVRTRAPNSKNPNLVPIGNGFGFLVYLDYPNFNSKSKKE